MKRPVFRNAFYECATELILTLVFFGIGYVILSLLKFKTDDFDLTVLIGIIAVALAVALVLMYIKLAKKTKTTQNRRKNMMLKREDIRIRDPFIFTDNENGCYYMYGTTALIDGSTSTLDTFSVYKTYDLESFEAPKVIFNGKKIDFWADRDFWAPEVHRFNGKYYLFASFKSTDRHRGTQILVCDTPDGEFVPVSEFPVTPEEWECLDGTLWVENGVPYIVFCHEWTQVQDGQICALQLSCDLSHSVGEPFLLFHASDSPHVTPHRGSKNYITDGPFLFKENEKLKMLWSSFSNGRYLVLCSESDSLRGKWKHSESQFDFDGGHAMLFERLDGKRMISLHSPNRVNYERAHFYKF